MKQQKINQGRKTFLTRGKSAIFIASFLVVYFLLLVFSDENLFTPIKDVWQAQFVLNFICVLMMIPIIYFVANEITNLCFPGHFAVFVYTACALFVLTMGSSIFLIGGRYGLWEIRWALWQGPHLWEGFALYLIICLSGVVFFTIISTLVWIIMSRHIIYVGRKTRVWYPLLVFILNTFFVGFIYTTIIHGWSSFMFLIIASVGCDVFAYLGGTHFGRHKLAPKISPKKTWEGLVFGEGITLVICLGVVGLLFIPGIEKTNHPLYCFLGCQSCHIYNNGVLMNHEPYYWIIYVLAFIVLINISVSGDLFFSWVKLRFNIKDFSNLIPGHGGMLDRLDALIFIFTFYFLVTVIIQLAYVAITKDPYGINFLWTRDIKYVF